MRRYPDLFVLRHGQTVWNLTGRLQGRLDSPLTALGEEQARLQGRILAAFGGLTLGFDCYSSSQKRATDTAALALETIGVSAQSDACLQEIDIGIWTGMTRFEIDAEYPGMIDKSDGKAWHFDAPNGESFTAVRGRVDGFLDRLTGPSIVITHGITSTVLRGLWLGLSRHEMLRLPHEQGCVYHLSGGKERRLTLEG